MFIVSKLTILFLLIINCAFADSYIVFVKGNAYVKSKDKETKIVKGMEILNDDEIITKAGALVILKVEGHSVHKIGELSTLHVSTLPVNFENSTILQAPASMILKAGKVLSNIIKKSGNESIKIKAKDSVMGIRGTQFYLEHNDNHEISLLVKEGQVEVENKLNQDIVEANQELLISSTSKFHSLGEVKAHDEIQWSFNSAEEIKRKTSLERKVKRKATYRRDEVRWKKFREQRVKKFKEWKLNTKKLVRKLVKNKETRSFKDMSSYEDIRRNKQGKNKILNRKIEKKMDEKSSQIEQRQRKRQFKRDAMMRRLRNKKEASSHNSDGTTSSPTPPGSP